MRDLVYGIAWAGGILIAAGILAWIGWAFADWLRYGAQDELLDRWNQRDGR